MAIDRTGISSLDAGASDITYAGNEGPKSPQEEQQMMLAQLKEEYEQYRMQQMEIDPSKVLSFQEWYQATYEASRQGVASGGIARLGYRGGQLVQPGPGRPGYQGPLYAAGPSKGPAGGQTMSGGGGYSDAERYQAQQAASTPAPVSIGHETGQVDPGLAAAAGIGPAAAGFAGTTDVGGPDLETQFKDYTKKPKFMGPTISMINKVGPSLQTKKQFIASIRNRRNYIEQYLPDQLDWYDDLDDKTKGSTDMMNFLNSGITSAREDIPTYGEFLNEQGNPNLMMAGNVGGMNQIGGDNQVLPNYYAPRDVHPGTGETTDATGTEIEPIEEFPVERLGPIYADGGRAGYAGGGITDLRQAYGLGKLVKKATRAVKKLAKSDIGKAALTWAAFNYGPGLLSGTGFGMGTAGKGLPGWKKLLAGGFDPSKGGMNIMRGITGASALGGLFTKMTEDDEDEDKTYQDWLAEKNRWLGQIGEFPVGRGDPLYQRNLMAADGGRIGYAKGGNDEELSHRTAALSAMYKRMSAQEGGLMDMGGMEKDYREEGGFVPIGGQERADDVPARLSKNEFVFTADAVRAAGGGDIDAGAEVMENVMNNLEQGGQVSEESQGLEGARDMFATSQRLEGVM